MFFFPFSLTMCMSSYLQILAPMLKNRDNARCFQFELCNGSISSHEIYHALDLSKYKRFILS